MQNVVNLSRKYNYWLASPEENIEARLIRRLICAGSNELSKRSSKKVQSCKKHRFDKTHLENYLDLGRIVIGCVCFLLLVCTVARGQVSLPAEEQRVTASQRPACTLLRFDEDWSFLKNKSLRTDLWDPIKYIPLDPDKPNEYISIGGEFRGTYEHVLNDNFTQAPF
jgi:hypothetical protein